jgi:cytochrome P450
MSSAAAGLDPLIRLDPAALRCPHAAFDRLREEEPVTFVPEIDCWVVSRYADIAWVTRHPELYSSRMPTGPTMARQQAQALTELLADEPAFASRLTGYGGAARILINADPPDHLRQRKLVNRAFVPPKVKTLEPRIREVAHRLVDGFIERGEAELVRDYAVLLPLTIIAECLGVDDGDLDVFKQWSDDFVAGLGNHDMSKEQLRSLVVSQNEFFTYFTERIAERRVEPRDDLISDIVDATLDGEPLTDPEMLFMFTQFLVAGNETTTKLITASVATLLQRPELMARLRSEPALTPGFIEEVLRLEPPVQGLYRRATADAELGGVTIRAGDHLLLLYAAGNRDERMFPRAGDLDPCRANAMQHLGFGHGEHYCLGSALARAEGRIALEVLLERLDHIRPAPGVDLDRLEYGPSYILRGLQRLPIVFAPSEPPS